MPRLTIDTLHQITSDVCATLLDLSPRPVKERAFHGKKWVVAAIRIMGDWPGELDVVAPAELAEQIAAVMFDKQADDLTDDEIVDAMGEFANIIAGNIRHLATDACVLSVPAVEFRLVGECDFEPRADRVEVLFAIDGHPIMVRVTQQSRRFCDNL